MIKQEGSGGFGLKSNQNPAIWKPGSESVQTARIRKSVYNEVLANATYHSFHKTHILMHIALMYIVNSSQVIQKIRRYTKIRQGMLRIVMIYYNHMLLTNRKVEISSRDIEEIWNSAHDNIYKWYYLCMILSINIFLSLN